MEESKFTYKAFISYTAHDTQFVNELEEWLIQLSEYTDADQKYIFFRDSSYSEAGESVEEGLIQRLKESERLILVCSPYINDYKNTEKNGSNLNAAIMHTQQITNIFMQSIVWMQRLHRQ